MSRIRIEYVPLAQVRRWPGNPKNHDIGSLRLSLERFGFSDPLAFDETTGRLIEGHGRTEALEQMRLDNRTPPLRIRTATDGNDWLVPVVRGIEFKTEAEATAYLVAHNRITEKGGWDEDALIAALDEVRKGTEQALEGTGFDNATYAQALAALDEVEEAAESLTTNPRAKLPEEGLATFETTDRRQLVFYFDGMTHDVIVARLATLMAQHNVASQALLFLRMLDAATAA